MASNRANTVIIILIWGGGRGGRFGLRGGGGGGDIPGLPHLYESLKGDKLIIQ